MKRNLKLLAMMGLPLLFASCANTDDLYDPAKADALLKAEYSANFIAKYGEIAPNQSWDATVSYPKYQASTRGMTSSEDWYNVDGKVIKWLDENLPNGKDNSKKGSSFVMTVPDNEFTIVPIYQGEAEQSWSLWIKVGDDDPYRIWSKSENLEYETPTGGWKNVSERWGDKKNTTVGATVRARKYVFDYSNRKGEPMVLYLKIEKGISGCANTGDMLGSDAGHMLALDMGELRPSGIDEKADVRVIACEDAWLEQTDHDMNDVVFLMYGNPKIPDITPTPEYRETIKTKRYMIEDLGSSDDFDFNDIVVDVEQIVKEELITEKSKLPYWKEVSKTQKATIRHLGGTLPFKLKIGDTQFEEMEGQMNVDPDTEYEIAGWIPAKNNISVQVRDLKNQGTHEFTFPKDGEVPMVIAVEPTVDWMQERVGITKDWFESLKKK